MNQKKYVRLDESVHFRLRLLAASLNKSVPEVCDELIDDYLQWLGLGAHEDFSVSDVRRAEHRFLYRLDPDTPQAHPDPKIVC